MDDEATEGEAGAVSSIYRPCPFCEGELVNDPDEDGPRHVDPGKAMLCPGKASITAALWEDDE